ncbi:unnamed protein product [Sympodiomycopsis kandeliae]
MRTTFLGLLAAAVTLPAVMAAPRPAGAPAFIPGQLMSASYGTGSVAPLHKQDTHPHIEGSYMVILKNGISATEFLAHRTLITAAQTSASAFHGASADSADGIGHIYDLENHMQGYAGKFTDDVVDYIRALPEVEYVELDSVVKTQDIPDMGNYVYQEGPASSIKMAPVPPGGGDDHKVLTQNGAPWGLARVSHRKELRLGTFSKYLYDSGAGEGVTAYVIDTGINIDHVEFEGRASWGKTMPAGSSDKDGNGHGSHCAGTMVSRKYGVAKKANIIAVKVLSDSGSGSMSDVTGGVLWAVEDAKKKSAALAAAPHSAAAKKHKGFVANMSLGGGKSPSLDRAVNGATDAGLAFAVAAGNENQDACNTSPAAAEGPVTVGASTIQDERAYFSNKGKCVDVFGPGLNILSVWNSGNTSTNTISGTSMASPHVAGILAYYLSLQESSGKATQASLFSSPTGMLRFLPLPDSLAYMTLKATQWLFGTDEIVAANTFEGFNFAGGILSALSPKDLKKVITKAATKGALSGLDTDTVNLLVFNNATSSSN